MDQVIALAPAEVNAVPSTSVERDADGYRRLSTLANRAILIQGRNLKSFAKADGMIWTGA
jgi:hypothetical protein